MTKDRNIVKKLEYLIIIITNELFWNTILTIHNDIVKNSLQKYIYYL